MLTGHSTPCSAPLCPVVTELHTRQVQRRQHLPAVEFGNNRPACVHPAHLAPLAHAAHLARRAPCDTTSHTLGGRRATSHRARHPREVRDLVVEADRAASTT